MGNKLLAGVWRYLIGVPPFLWEKQIKKASDKVQASTRFMTPDYRRVHHFVVRELALSGMAISAEQVAKELDLPMVRVTGILQDLEGHLTFLVRNDHGQVVWAYPVTIEKTPHFITFDTGEQLYAA
jgi:hypothetical protein